MIKKHVKILNSGVENWNRWREENPHIIPNLRRANLRGANLYKANLRGADLRRADMEGADLRGADLRGAKLWGADLRGAKLRGADLWGADMWETDLWGADLKKTCLDPNAKIHEIANINIIIAGLQIDGDYVVGYRTKKSQYYGNTTYEPGKTYTALVFSTSDTECHPGIYMAGEDWLKNNGYGGPYVKCRSKRCDLHKAGDKFRTRRLEVLKWN